MDQSQKTIENGMFGLTTRQLMTTVTSYNTVYGDCPVCGTHTEYPSRVSYHLTDEEAYDGCEEIQAVEKAVEVRQGLRYVSVNFYQDGLT